jgi:hypothetical protein
MLPSLIEKLPRNFRESRRVFTGLLHEAAAPGLYLVLMNSRNSPGEVKNIWGELGPAIGPLVSAGMTYAENIDLVFVNDETAKAFGFERASCGIKIDGGMIHYQGRYYSDWAFQAVMPN